jgi:hypothetical protein
MNNISLISKLSDLSQVFLFIRPFAETIEAFVFMQSDLLLSRIMHAGSTINYSLSEYTFMFMKDYISGVRKLRFINFENNTLC